MANILRLVLILEVDHWELDAHTVGVADWECIERALEIAHWKHDELDVEIAHYECAEHVLEVAHGEHTETALDPWG